MQRQEIYVEIKEYIVQKVLEESEDVDLDEHTPLLEWGILSSLDVIRLLSFIEQKYRLEIPVDMIDAEHFVHLAAITDMVIEMQETVQAI
jgi:acyl carrier protein